MRFQEAYAGWQEKRLTQEDAGQLLGVSARTFRRQIGRFEADGMQGLVDLRMSQVSSRRAPVDEVLGLHRGAGAGASGWNVKHFHTWYGRDHGGTRSYSWVKQVLQEAKLVVRAKARGQHPNKRERQPQKRDATQPSQFPRPAVSVQEYHAEHVDKCRQDH